MILVTAAAAAALAVSTSPLLAASCCYITLRQQCRDTIYNLPITNVIVFDSNLTIKSWTMTVLPGSTILNISRIYSLSVGICFLLLSLCKCYYDYGWYNSSSSILLFLVVCVLLLCCVCVVLKWKLIMRRTGRTRRAGEEFCVCVCWKRSMSSCMR